MDERASCWSGDLGQAPGDRCWRGWPLVGWPETINPAREDRQAGGACTSVQSALPNLRPVRRPTRPAQAGVGSGQSPKVPRGSEKCRHAARSRKKTGKHPLTGWASARKIPPRRPLHGRRVRRVDDPEVDGPWRTPGSTARKPSRHPRERANARIHVGWQAKAGDRSTRHPATSWNRCCGGPRLRRIGRRPAHRQRAWNTPPTAEKPNTFRPRRSIK